MLEDVLKNRQHILICIQYEVLQKKSIDEAYKSFCNILGENVMEYHEFDFWYYHFLNGNFDLDYERKMEPKPLELSDMPIEVAFKIVQKLNWKEKFIFRDVSKKCREVVDETPVIINEIFFYDSDRGTIVIFDDHSFEYGNHKKDNWVESDFEDEDYNEEEDKEGNKEKCRVYDREQCEKRAVQTLAIVLNNPKLQIKKLSFSIKGQNLVDKLHALFKSLNHQLHVEFFEYNDRRESYQKSSEEISLMEYLPHLKPGILGKIKVFNVTPVNWNFDSNFEKLAEMEQWKQAKQFETNLSIFDNIDKVAHFDYLSASVENYLKPEHVVYLKNVYLNSPTFKHCELFVFKVDEDRIFEKLGGDRFPMVDGSTLHVDVTHYSVLFTRE